MQAPGVVTGCCLLGCGERLMGFRLGGGFGVVMMLEFGYNEGRVRV
jgi:hypothetical protein